MATRLNDLFFKVVVDGKEAKVSLSQVSGAIKKAENQARSSFQKIGDFGRNAFFVFEGFRRLATPLGAMIKAANTLEASTRKLNATSKLTGANLDNLQKISSKAKTQFLLSTQQANEFTIQLTKLTQKAGDTSKTADAIGRLLDLAAAQGLDAAQAMTAIQQAILGIDEGTDKLFQKNPSVIYKEYAKQIGISAGKLTDQQKAQALLNAVMTDGLKVQGEYTKFLDSAAGKQALAATRTEELQAKLGKLINAVLIPLLEVGTRVLEWFTNLSPAAQKMGLAIAGATAALWFLRGAIQAVWASIGPAGWLILGLSAVVGLFFTFSTNAKAATSSMAGLRSEVRKFNIEQLQNQIATLNLEMQKLATGEGIEGPGGRFAKASSIRREQIKKEIEELERQIALIKAFDEKPTATTTTTTTRRERTLASFEIESQLPDTIPGAEMIITLQEATKDRLDQLKQESADKQKQIEEDKIRHFIQQNQLAFNTIEAGYDTFFGTILNKEMSAKEKREAIWESMKASFVGTVGDMLKAEILRQITGTSVTQAETAKRLSISLAAMAQEAAATVVSIGKTIGSIAAKLFAWFASKGPLGIALGLGAVPALVAAVKAVIGGLSKFATGGIGTQPTLAQVFEQGPEAIIPLDRRGADFMAQLIPKISVATSGGAGSQADFDALGERIAAAVENVRIELHGVLSGQEFLRKEFDNFQKSEVRRTF